VGSEAGGKVTGLGEEAEVMNLEMKARHLMEE